ncbi:hypothetical protein RHMOL_Rhmol02G0286800 [Rhododendron molle]|uniref:Uncharacterized protein n=1 Tax=Rhododendron molle TaxID=49168 RepID=A0ACC0PVM6_RHOML|nr:hypothetical protein RHMOL_Rhmol02G0286800 [Rhododendron molle]
MDADERVSDDSRMELVQDDQEQKEGDEDDNAEYEDETDDEEEEEEEDGDGACAFRFEGEMDPLAFPDDDTLGVQHYQQFERLEHEYGALAERKRKSLSHHHLLPPRSGFGGITLTPVFHSDGLGQTISNLSNPWSESPVNKSRQEDFNGASMEEIMEVMNYGRRKKSRKQDYAYIAAYNVGILRITHLSETFTSFKQSRKRGRRKGSKNKLNPEVTRKLGDATLHYAHGRYEEAIFVLKEVIRVAPNFPDPYHTLGLIYRKIGDKKKALNFYMLAAHLTPKDSSLWKLLVTWSIEQGNAVQARYCLWKAITADPADMSLRFSRASLYVELGEYQKAAESYEQISQLCPENVEALKTATMFYQKCGQKERSVSILEDYLKSHPSDADLGVVDLLASTCMNNSAHTKALQHIEDAHRVYCAGKELPLYLRIRAGICLVHLGDDKKAESIFSVLQRENVYEHPHLVREVADSLMALGHYKFALKYYMMLEGIGEDKDETVLVFLSAFSDFKLLRLILDGKNPKTEWEWDAMAHDSTFGTDWNRDAIRDDISNQGSLHVSIAQCYLSVGDRGRAIEYLYTALCVMEDSVDARLTLASLLLDDDKQDEAISVLSPSKSTDSQLGLNSDKTKPWWLNWKIKLKLSCIYKTKGMTEAFVDAIFPFVRESLFLETIQQKVRGRKRPPKSDLFERDKVLDACHAGNLFQQFRAVGSASDLSKASRAKRLLQKKAGLDWKSENSNEDSLQAMRDPPLPNLLKDEEHHHLIIDLCKLLASLKRYWEAIEVINLTLKLASKTLSVEKREELQSLGAQIAYNITDPSHGWDYARHIVNQNPYSFAAWNCYYKVVSRLGNRYSKHNKLLHGMRVKHKVSIPPIIIAGHQLNMISQHQAAAREYLEAYKLMPDSPLVNLCVGTALINLALGLRLQNKHRCLLQGLAFLYNNLRLCESSQEALYNIARAYHHLGLVTLAAAYYEKVLAIHEKDYPIPKLPNENPDGMDNQKKNYCDLGREAAYNLHLIYKTSGALDLARQVLKDHCTF